MGEERVKARLIVVLVRQTQETDRGAVEGEERRKAVCARSLGVGKNLLLSCSYYNSLWRYSCITHEDVVLLPGHCLNMGIECTDIVGSMAIRHQRPALYRQFSRCR
jgi:hypothetical protein